MGLTGYGYAHPIQLHVAHCEPQQHLPPAHTELLWPLHLCVLPLRQPPDELPHRLLAESE